MRQQKIYWRRRWGEMANERSGKMAGWVPEEREWRLTNV